MGIELIALARSVAARIVALAERGGDEVRVVDRLLERLEIGRERYGLLDLGKARDWRRERFEERLDALVYDVAGELAAEDLALANLREAARAEQVELEQWRERDHRTVASDESARIAMADIDDRAPYEAFDTSDVDEQERTP